jgi:hypothetical protein
MTAKLNLNGPYLQFHCPGCGFDHAVDSKWTWNGSVEKPSFQPSVKYDGSKGICHFYVTDGKIQFCTDCTAHKLGGQTVDLPDWETKEKPVMAEVKKDFKRGDLVTITAPHISGVVAEVLWEMVDGKFVCRIAGSAHPSGHSQEGTMVVFPPDQLEPLAAAEKAGAQKKEVQL